MYKHDILAAWQGFPLSHLTGSYKHVLILLIKISLLNTAISYILIYYMSQEFDSNLDISYTSQIGIWF